MLTKSPSLRGITLMPAGTLLSAYAAAVAPPRQKTTFTGGQITATSQLQAALDSAFDQSKIATACASRAV